MHVGCPLDALSAFGVWEFPRRGNKKLIPHRGDRGRRVEERSHRNEKSFFDTIRLTHKLPYR